MHWWICGLGAVMLVSCGGPPEVLAVKQFHLREVEAQSGESEVVRAEKLKRLHGAVSAEQHRDRLGEYFTVRWNGPAGRESEPLRLVFDYQQATTASQVLTMEQKLAGTAKGTAEFHVSGKAYQTGGRVLAWRIRMFRGDDLVETRRSYLWN
jgi:hypothetical protein